MASKTGQAEPGKADIEELLDVIEKTLDRVKVLYEQYFLGMQKQPPTHIHNDVERRLRDLMQVQIRNTGLRYRFATLQQKFGSYNTYWRRTLRQIENGTYLRQLSKISRQAVQTGEEIPDEILAAMPKRMRDQFKRDREQAIAIAKRREHAHDGVDADFADEEAPAMIGESPAVRSAIPKNHHVLDAGDADLDIDAFFASVTDDARADDTQPNAAAYVDPTPAPRPAPIRPPSITSRQTGPVPIVPAPAPRQTGPLPIVPAPARPSGQIPTIPPVQRPSGAIPTIPPVQRPSGAIPTMPAPPPRAQTNPVTAPPRTMRAATEQDAEPRLAPSQVSRPNPIAPGSSQARPQVPVQTMSGPFPREPGPAARPTPRPQPTPTGGPPMRPPPGMNDADVNALYATYVKAKQMVGENAGPGAYGKLLKTINAQAPKIMEQYKAKGVEFSVVVKDNQVIIKAKPKP